MAVHSEKATLPPPSFCEIVWVTSLPHVQSGGTVSTVNICVHQYTCTCRPMNEATANILRSYRKCFEFHALGLYVVTVYDVSLDSGQGGGGVLLSTSRFE